MQHREEPQEQRVRGREVGHPPPRRHELGDRLQRAVEVAPRRWAGQLAAGAQLEHRVDEHPRETPWLGPAIATCIHIGSSPTTRRPAPAVRHCGLRHSSQPIHEPEGDHEVGAIRQGQPGQDAGDEPADVACAGSVDVRGAHANTALHSVSASPPFQAIAVRPIGVRM